MRQFFFYILLGSFCMVAACKKTSTTATGSPMSAVINNKSWHSNNTLMTFEKGSGTQLVITGDSATSRMVLSIGNYHGVGTYIIADTGNTASYTDATGQLHKATSGQIKVDTATTNGTNTNYFKGTFQFLADSYQVTNGTYSGSLYLN